MRKSFYLVPATLLTMSLLTGCGSTSVSQDTAATETLAETKEDQTGEDSAKGPGQMGDTSVEDIDFDQELSQSDMDTDFTDREKDSSYDEASASHIDLNGSSITTDGSGVSVSDNIVTITEEGTYVISGTLDDGQILVDAEDSDKIQIVLNDATVSCATNAPIYIKQADKVFITLADGTTSQLSDEETYELEDDTNVDAVIFSKADLALNGNGTLIIQASYKHGIVSKDDLVITSGTYEITSTEQALKAKDQLKILDGTFTLNAGDTAIKAKNEDDTTLGNIYVAGGTFTIQSGEDGLNATGSIVIDGGTWTVDAGDDGFHADLDAVVNDGQIDITNCYEGLEGLRVVVNGGDITIHASDDGVNAASGSGSSDSTGDVTPPQLPEGDMQDMTPPERPDGESNNRRDDSSNSDKQNMTPPERPDGDNSNPGDDNMVPGKMGGGFPGMGGSSMENNTDAYIKITGGNLTVYADGDGIDSNGSLLVTGGNTIVNGPVSDVDGALDYNGGAKVTGGSLLAIGSSGMLQTFGSASTQGYLTYKCSGSQESGTQITLTDAQGNQLYSYTAQKQFASIVLTLPDLTAGETYTLTVGDHTEEITIS